MTRLRSLFATVTSVLLLCAPASAFQPPASAGEYVPATPGTATEQLPAAPLLIVAYAFVWIAAMFYVWTVWRRLGKVESEMQTLARRQASESRR